MMNSFPRPPKRSKSSSVPPSFLKFPFGVELNRSSTVIRSPDPLASPCSVERDLSVYYSFSQESLHLLRLFNVRTLLSTRDFLSIFPRPPISKNFALLEYSCDGLLKMPGPFQRPFPAAIPDLNSSISRISYSLSLLVEVDSIFPFFPSSPIFRPPEK